MAAIDEAGGDATGNNARRGRCDSVVVVTGQRSM